MNHQRDLYKAAVALRDRLLAIRARPPHLHVPDPGADEIAALVRQYDRAHRRGWDGAAIRLRNRLWNVVSMHRNRVEDLHDALRQNPHRVPDVGELYADLASLREEFEDVRFDRKKRQLVVRTEPIVLEGVSLGAFDLVLHIAKLGELYPYDVVAVDPHAASSNGEITHPHVDGESICEGEGKLPIRRALEQGRFLDFFVLVDRILHTHNAASAYVPLSEWGGTPCHDCGSVVDEDDRYDCSRCGVDLCCDCTPCCGDCGDMHCGSCLDTCRSCDRDFCPSCLTRCEGCERDFCKDHIDDRFCDDCRPEEEEDDDEATTSAPAAADSVRMGQAPVPA